MRFSKFSLLALRYLRIYCNRVFPVNIIASIKEVAKINSLPQLTLLCLRPYFCSRVLLNPHHLWILRRSFRPRLTSLSVRVLINCKVCPPLTHLCRQRIVVSSKGIEQITQFATVCDQPIGCIFWVVVKHIGVEVFATYCQLLVHRTFVTGSSHHSICCHPVLGDRAYCGVVLCIEVLVTFFREAGTTVAVPELMVLVFSHFVADRQVIGDHVRSIVLTPALHSGNFATSCLHLTSHS